MYTTQPTSPKDVERDTQQRSVYLMLTPDDARIMAAELLRPPDAALEGLVFVAANVADYGEHLLGVEPSETCPLCGERYRGGHRTVAILEGVAVAAQAHTQAQGAQERPDGVDKGGV